jgi:inner membrane protein
MDPFTHYLSAKITLQIFLKEKTNRLISLFVLASVLPDIDYITRIIGGRAVYLKYHRGITHSFFGICILSIVLAFIFSRNDKKSFNKLFLLSYAAMFIHLLFDWTNSYGTQLLLPFSDKRMALDSVFIMDFYLLALFTIALVLIFFSKKNKFKISIFFTAITVFYIVIKIIFNLHVVSRLERIPLNSEKISVAAFPDTFLPFNFKCVIETEDKFYTFDYSLLNKYDTDKLRYDMSEYTKVSNNEYTDLVNESYLGDVFLDFARYPHYYMEKAGDNHLVKITDLRYKRSKDREGFTARFLISKDMKVIQQNFNF